MWEVHSMSRVRTLFGFGGTFFATPGYFTGILPHLNFFSSPTWPAWGCWSVAKYMYIYFSLPSLLEGVILNFNIIVAVVALMGSFGIGIYCIGFKSEVHVHVSLLISLAAFLWHHRFSALCPGEGGTLCSSRHPQRRLLYEELRQTCHAVQCH